MGPERWPALPHARDRLHLSPPYTQAKGEVRRALGVPDGYDSCAIVGSSGRLLTGTNGPAIDEHAMVMRMNTAPTAGFEAYVGTRTTMRLVATTGLNQLLHDNCNNYDERVCPSEASNVSAAWCPISDVMFNSFGSDSEPTVQALAARVPEVQRFLASCGSTGKQMMQMSQTQRALVNETLTPPGYHFMSGLAGVLLAVLLCDSGVDLYGFDVDNGTQGADSNTSYHYYDTGEPAATDDIEASTRLLRQLLFREPHCVRKGDGSSVAK